MKSRILIATVAYAVMIGAAALARAELPVLEEMPLSEIEDALCEQDGAMACAVQGKVLLAQGRGKREKFNCVEACSKVRYRCERTDKNRPGTKANDRASAKCQEKYRGCLDKCENPTAQ